jgi:hypothetical protein
LIVKKQKEDQTRMQVRHRLVTNNNIQGYCLPKETTYFRLKIMKMCFIANISLNAICGVGKDLHSIIGETLGGYRGLDYLIPVIHSYHDGEVKQFISKCFKQFSITHDGTPYFA